VNEHINSHNAPKVRTLARDAGQTHVLFNNCYRDYARVNAQQLAALLQRLTTPREDLRWSDLPRENTRICREQCGAIGRLQRGAGHDVKGCISASGMTKGEPF
jgi:hypothetical protein